MPSVWIQKKGQNWRCYWRRGGRGSPRESQNCGTKEAHARWFMEQKRLELEGHAVGLPKKSSTVSIKEAATNYLEEYCRKEKSPRTYRNFDKPYVDDMVGFFPGKRLCDLTPKDGYRWKHHLQEVYKGSTPSMAWRVGRAFLNYLVRVQDLTTDPWKEIEAPDEGEEGGRALTDAEAQVLFSVVPPELYRAGHFAVGAGPRIGEVCAFDWSRVRDERVHGDKVWFGRIPAQERKTRKKVKKDCLFPIVGMAREVMGKRQASGRVFPYAISTLQHQLIAVREKAHLPDVTFHWFRHTFATRYLKYGGHAEDLLATRLWTDPRSLDRYIHVDLETLADRFSRVPCLPGATKSEGPRSVKPRA